MTRGAYDDALGYLYALSSRGVDLGLARVEAALASIGNPHTSLKVVHVAGTNGKGSVSALVERALRSAGYKTGLYTSPHLHRFGERIRVDGRPISDAAVVRRVRDLRVAGVFDSLTFFEAATVMAFVHFAESGCDVAVVEVGLGGRLDATNVVDPEVSVVTNIGLDHTAWLGTTHATIAAEKVAIAKPNRTLVHGARQESARAVIASYCRANRVRVVDLVRDVAVEVAPRARAISVRWGEHAVRDVPKRLAGDHQRDNLALAVVSLLVLRERGFRVDDDAIRTGASKVRWPARLETVSARPRVLLDGAHNREGCLALAAHLRTMSLSPRVLVFGGMADKDLAGMLACFDGLVDRVVYVAPNLARAESPRRLAGIRGGDVAPSVEEGLRIAKTLAGPDGLVVGAGSLFVVAALRAQILGLRVDPPIAM